MKNTEKVNEAVGVFEDIEKLRHAVTELESTDFGRESISVLGNKKDIEEQFGSPEVSPELAGDHPDTPREPPIRTEEKAIGTGVIIGGGAYVGALGAVLAAGAAVSVPAVITAAAIGGGGGGLLAKILSDRFEESTEKQIEKGGMLLWVQTHGPQSEELAQNILLKHGAKNVHMHETV